jgi:plasminogen activator inhibitor 1 RNA-binding protein
MVSYLYPLPCNVLCRPFREGRSGNREGGGGRGGREGGRGGGGRSEGPRPNGGMRTGGGGGRGGGGRGANIAIDDQSAFPALG